MQGAIVTFTKGLSHQLIGKGIRVNCIAPGPVWTPLIPMSFDNNTVGCPPYFRHGDWLRFLACGGCLLVIAVFSMGQAWLQADTATLRRRSDYAFHVSCSKKATVSASQNADATTCILC